MNDVAAWLMTGEGRAWSWRTRSHDPTIYHDMVELKDDYTTDQIADHMWICSNAMMDLLRQMPGWHDLKWEPDLSP